MKKYLLYAGSLAIPLAIGAFTASTGGNKRNESVSNDGIQFIDSSWSAALGKVQKENKLIFLETYASWCGPCKMLKLNTLTKKEAGDFFNTHIINVAIDMEKGDGLTVAQKFYVTAYPTLIIEDKNGNRVTNTQGYMSGRRLVEFGQYGLQKHQ